MIKSITKKIMLLAVAGVMAVSAWGDPIGNIAAGKTTKSGWSRLPDTGTSPNANELSGKAVDENTGTQYISYGIGNNSSRAWWAVDLGAAYRLSYINVVWNNSRTPSHYLIQVMTETPSDFVDDVAMSDAGWETVLEVKESQVEGTGGNHYDLGAITARYIRLVPKDRSEIGLNEFEVYADALASEPVTTPTITAATLQSDLSAGSATVTLTATDHNGDALHTFLLEDQTGKFYRVTTDGSDQTTISGLSNKRYAFTVWAIEDGCLSATSQTIIVGEGTFDAEANLALNKPAYAVRYQGNSSRRPDKANDGNLGGEPWNAGGDSGEAIAEADRENVWWYVDLQDQYDLKYISIFYTGAYATSIIMQIRKEAPTIAQANDDSAWETFLEYSGTPKDGDSEDKANLYGDVTGTALAFSKVAKGRYVRFRAINAHTWDWGVQVREIRVFGNSYLPLDDEKPVISVATYNGTSADRTELKFNISVSDNVTAVNALEYVVEDPSHTEHNASYDEGVLTVAGMPTFKKGDITIYAMDEAGNKSDGFVIENLSYVHPEDNLAELKTTWVSYTNNQNNEKQANLNDGVLNTNGWLPWHNSGANPWMVVDLGDAYQITKVQTFFASETRTSTNYKIYGRQDDPLTDEVRADNTKWIELASKSSSITTGSTESDVNESSITFTGAIRYVRFESFAEADNNAYNSLNLLEFRVFASEFKDPDITAPVISAASYNGVTDDYTSLKFNITVSDNVTAVEDLVYTVEDPEGVEHDATYSEGVITVLGMPTFKNQGITLYAYDAVPNKSTGYVVENVSYVDPNENLALNKAAYACVHINDGEGKLMPVDGNPSTTWTSYSSAHHDNDWWYVDLGDFYDIRRIEVVWQENRHSTDFSIQYRQNAPEGDSGATEAEWETKYVNLSGDKELDDISGMQARYICMRSKDYIHEQDYAQVRLAEFRVFGKAFATADANPPVITTAFVSYNDDGKAYLNLQATDTEDGVVTTFRVTDVTNSTVETLSTDANNQIVIDGLTLNTQYTFEIEAVDNADNHSAVVELKVNIPYTTSTNIAPRGTATAGYNNPGNSGEHAGAANDDRTNTAWVTYGCSVPADLWWEVELDGLYHLTKIAVLWNDNNYVTKYTIQTRESATDAWTSLPQVTVSETGLKETATDLNARFVRIVVDEQRFDFSRMHEVRVYADAKILSFADDATDNSDLIEANHGQPANVILNRSILANNTWYTLCVPFDMDADKVNEVFGSSTIAELTGAEDRGSLIHLNFDYVHAIEAGHAYLIMPGQDFTAGSTISGVTIKNVDPEALASQTEYMHFQGTFNKIMLEGENKRFMGANNYVYSPRDGGTPVGAFRCFFTIPDNAPANVKSRPARIVFGEQTATGVETINNDQSPITGKILINGMLYIIRDGRTYNAQGMLVE